MDPDSSVDASYGVPEERITPEAGAADAGAFIVRLDAGSSDVYLRKARAAKFNSRWMLTLS